MRKRWLRRKPQRPRLLRFERQARKKGHRLIAGVDEAGRGPLAGPVVAASVILGKASFSARIDDSKKLSSAQRYRAFREIVSSSLVSVGIISHHLIDDINIYEATRLAMKEAVSGLGVKPDFALVDGRMRLDLPCSHKCIVRGDALSLSVAAASIVAKVVRDSIMLDYSEHYPQYGFSAHKGYPTKTHIKKLLKLGPCSIHRKSFRPVKNLIKEGCL
ncbi:MAG: ribonuclease HII [Candidatus Omnitrophota bacterium]